VINITPKRADRVGLFGTCLTIAVFFFSHRATASGEKEMTEFLTNMPTDTKIFITMAVLGLAGTLIVLRRLI
jgi:hypothetical protein